jgi:cellulose synthase/poly-beta-1,6-N-acetylglucosamine synthase-like glycosyltransferase
VQLVTIEFNVLKGIHPQVDGLMKKNSSLMYSSNINDYSEKSLSELLKLYPIHVIPINDEAKYWVIAGLRQYELLVLYHSKHQSKAQGNEPSVLHTIPVLVHDKIGRKGLRELVAFDIAGSAIMFSLGTKVAEQLQLIKQSMPEETVVYFPKLDSVRRMSDR